MSNRICGPHLEQYYSQTYKSLYYPKVFAFAFSSTKCLCLHFCKVLSLYSLSAIQFQCIVFRNGICKIIYLAWYLHAVFNLRACLQLWKVLNHFIFKNGFFIISFILFFQNSCMWVSQSVFQAHLLTTFSYFLPLLYSR